jgi:hypothetical protein
VRPAARPNQPKAACSRCDILTRRANHILKNRSDLLLCQAPFEKRFLLSPTPNHRDTIAILSQLRGVGQRRKRGTGAVDARALLDGQQSSGRPSRVVLAPRRWCQVRETQVLRAMVANKPGTPGRSRSNRKTIAQEMPGDPGEPVVNTLVCLFTHLHARLRAHRAPGISCALIHRGKDDRCANPGEAAPREYFWLFENWISFWMSSPANGSRECAPDDKLQRATQYSRDAGDRAGRPRRTGYPACAGYDDSFVGQARATIAQRRRRYLPVFTLVHSRLMIRSVAGSRAATSNSFVNVASSG